MSLSQPLNRYIDHTLLQPAAMDIAFEGLLDEAVKFNFHSVCVSPYIAVPTVHALKPYPDIKVCTVVAFPHGNIPLELKIKEAAYFASHGVHEIDWVLHYGEVLNERWDNVEKEVHLMGEICKSYGAVSKCIVETAILKHPDTLVRIYNTLFNGSEVDFIKTSTGFAGEGAKLEHVRTWSQLRGNNTRLKIKAAGGIKTAEQARAFIEAGADRLGTSASVDIMEQEMKNNVG
jgi:deoxyribose-phosphate aldolase